MEKLRRKFQGTGNILRFNYHYYLAASLIIITLMLIAPKLPVPYRPWAVLLALLTSFLLLVSLMVSLYVYDISGLYKLEGLSKLKIKPGSTMINIHAGFDETSSILAAKYPSTNLSVYDFYNPTTHTEISIRRARKAYPPYQHTISVSSDSLPAKTGSADFIFLILAAHEIRQEEERIRFFLELKRILRPNGKIVLIEHLRDLSNFLAYNIGFFHFLSRHTWQKAVDGSGLLVVSEFKNNPFITTIIITTDGTAN